MRMSLIVPVGPIYRWLGEACQSALRQELPQDCTLELILAVDGPAGLAAAREVAATDRRVGLVYLAEPRGPYAVLNAALPHARGEVLGKTDADDLLLPGRLAAIAHVFATDSDAHLVNTLYAIGDSTLSNLTHHGYAPEGVWMMRRSLIDRLGGWQPWPCGADTDLLMRADVLVARRVIVDQVLYVARRHADSLTQAPATGYTSAARQDIIRILSADAQRYRKGASPTVIPPYDGLVSVEGPLFMEHAA